MKTTAAILYALFLVLAGCGGPAFSTSPDPDLRAYQQVGGNLPAGDAQAAPETAQAAPDALAPPVAIEAGEAATEPPQGDGGGVPEGASNQPDAVAHEAAVEASPEADPATAVCAAWCSSHWQTCGVFQGDTPPGCEAYDCGACGSGETCALDAPDGGHPGYRCLAACSEVDYAASHCGDWAEHPSTRAYAYTCPGGSGIGCGRIGGFNGVGDGFWCCP